ncbi:MAG: hypothetical protein COU32_00040 [Candidatus Magasanikbacteria bacterium CG10_big_fil_rev_8_21_14_0_10_42_10]|uniref:riboflavin kinase n=2 Tax=Candidatus Magasanikiibacteriota TaxID=1752731 RepID=A0A2H0TXE6_9BACT|nr:MAG: hypothetical protein COU32_00040 [Candidatus Magasanikbacteria bacterium CG10_big_fil_rev_8_21_14_0_10_42_10]PIZ93086.1 MAG: hypothetical protein COX82_03405 [Candidatus Magasanikbacteria bacterium CG_4_10_14_0_2_um_filter_41_10]
MFGGIVIHGDGVGGTLGYPTANIDCPSKDVHFDPGVYAAKATYQGKVYKAALVIMKTPWKVEVHLLDFDGSDIYGQELRFEPIQRVSALERYDDIEELKEKIARDILSVQQVFQQIL